MATSLTPNPRPRAATVIAIIWLALSLRLLLLGYFTQWRGITPLNLSSDAIQYDLLANALLAGDWAFSSTYFAVRPPLMPLFTALLYTLLGPTQWAVALGNAILAALTAGIAAQATHRFTRNAHAALLAGLFVAIDPASIANNINLQAETLSNFFLALTLLEFAAFWQRPTFRTAFLIGLWLALATLARPTPLYFFMMAAPLVVLAARTAQPPRAWTQSLALVALVTLLPLATLLGWSQRNRVYLGVATFSTVSDFNLLFYRAVSVERFATGADDDLIRRQFAAEVDQRLGLTTDPSAIDSGYFWGNFIPDSPERLATVRQLALETYLAHPVAYLATIPFGLLRMYAYTSTYGNPFVPELIYNGLFYLTAMLGAVIALRRRHWPLLLTALLFIGYFTAVTLVSQTTGMDTRMRTPVTPALALLAALALHTLWVATKNRRASAPVSKMQ